MQNESNRSSKTLVDEIQDEMNLNRNPLQAVSLMARAVEEIERLIARLCTWQASCTGKHGSQMSCVGSTAPETADIRQALERLADEFEALARKGYLPIQVLDDIVYTRARRALRGVKL